jgi:hypothetical protein
MLMLFWALALRTNGVNFIYHAAASDACCAVLGKLFAAP